MLSTMQAMHERERESDEGLLTIDGFRCRYQVPLRPLAATVWVGFPGGGGAVEGLLCRDPEKSIEKRRLAERILLGQLEKLPVSDRERYVENTARL